MTCDSKLGMSLKVWSVVSICGCLQDEHVSFCLKGYGKERVLPCHSITFLSLCFIGEIKLENDTGKGNEWGAYFIDRMEISIPLGITAAIENRVYMPYSGSGQNRKF